MYDNEAFLVTEYVNLPDQRQAIEVSTKVHDQLRDSVTLTFKEARDLRAFLNRLDLDK